MCAWLKISSAYGSRWVWTKTLPDGQSKCVQAVVGSKKHKEDLFSLLRTVASTCAESQAQVNRGLIEMKIKDWAGALKDFEDSKAIAPDQVIPSASALVLLWNGVERD